MATPFGKKGRNPGAVDNWLDTLGFYRKNVANDETCLFRAISEQLFDCQIHHERVRRECIDFARKNYRKFSDVFGSREDFFEHLDRLEKHMVVCGNIEIQIISKKYNRCIIIFDGAEHEKFYINTESKELFLLCLIDKDHFDVVYKKEHISNAGFCQSIVYKVLYEQVFGIENVDEVVHNMLYEKNNIITQAKLLMDKKKQCSESGSKDSAENEPQEKADSLNIAPFPFKIAKALDPNIYRNIEYDVWGETRKEWRLGEWYYGDNKLILGTKCIYNDKNTGDKYDCYIQEIFKNENKCVIYLTKLTEKRTVNYSDLSPEDDAKPWPLPYRFTKSIVITPNSPTEKSAAKPKKKNRDKKRTKSESSILSNTAAIKHEPPIENLEAYVGAPLQMQGNKVSDTYNQKILADSQAISNVAPDNIPIENEGMENNGWFANGYQWPPYVPQAVDPLGWPTSPVVNQNVFNFNVKPMVASAPVTPSVIPYHDPNYYYDYHVASYDSYPQWSPAPAPFQLQAPPPPRAQQQKLPEQESGNKNMEIAQYDENQNCDIADDSLGECSAMNSQPPRTPNYAETYASYSSVDMYSPVSQMVPQVIPSGPMIYQRPPPPLTVSDLMVPTSPMVYSPPMEMSYVPTSPYVYPPTPPQTWYSTNNSTPPTWYAAGITPQGFIFPARP